MITAFTAAISRGCSYARAITLLRGYNDSRLRNIGISRDQIEMFVDGRIWECRAR